VIWLALILAEKNNLRWLSQPLGAKVPVFFDYKLYLLFQGSGELLNLMFTPGNVSGRHRCSAGDEHPFQYKKYPPAP